MHARQAFGPLYPCMRWKGNRLIMELPYYILLHIITVLASEEEAQPLLTG